MFDGSVFGYKVDEVDEKGWWWWLMRRLQADRSASVQLVHRRTGPYKESQLQRELLVCIEVLKIDIIFAEYLSIIKLVPPRNLSSFTNKNFFVRRSDNFLGEGVGFQFFK